MANPLEQAINSAVRANDRIGRFFAQVGTEAHPRGFVISAYRNAERAMKSALKEQNREEAAREVLNQLERSLLSGFDSLYQDAQDFGSEEALRQMAYYGFVVTLGSINLFQQRQSATQATMAKFNAQRAAILAMLLTGATDEQILGDDERTGVLRHSDLSPTAAFWLTALLWDSFEYTATAQPDYTPAWKKQAIAALDNKTTDCCLRVHAQIQPMNKQFHLTGEPRYADYIEWPGFHWWCRTSGVLYLAEFDRGLTQQMRAGANTVLQERENGIFRDRHPADAYG